MNELTLSTALETALNRIEDMLAGDDGQAFKEARKFLPVGRAALAEQPGAVGLTDEDMDAVIVAIAELNMGDIGYHAFCDRIVRLAAAPTEAKPAPAPGYCKHCKQYTIEEPLPAQQDAVDAEWKVGPLTDELALILGRPNFTCIRYAEMLRELGQEIPRKAEAEQAAVIHWMLGFYATHGDKWAEAAVESMDARRAAISAKKGTK